MDKETLKLFSQVENELPINLTSKPLASYLEEDSLESVSSKTYTSLLRDNPALISSDQAAKIKEKIKEQLKKKIETRIAVKNSDKTERIKAKIRELKEQGK
jgi:hypothetical protein